MLITFRVERLVVSLDSPTLALANRFLTYLEGAQQQQKEIDALTARVIEITNREHESAVKLQTAVDSTT